MTRGSRRRARWATGLGIGVAAVFFFLMLFDFATDAQRQATGIGFASQFFDLQAQRDPRRPPVGAERRASASRASTVDGRTYSYFGIFPALLRIPVQLVTDEYDGKLTLISMAVAWVVFAVMATRLFWLIRECLGRPRHLATRSRRCSRRLPRSGHRRQRGHLRRLAAVGLPRGLPVVGGLRGRQPLLAAARAPSSRAPARRLAVRLRARCLPDPHDRGLGGVSGDAGGRAVAGERSPAPQPAEWAVGRDRRRPWFRGSQPWS